MARALTALATLIAAAGLGGCFGGDGSEESRISGRTLTIYSSLPAHGASASAARAVAAGEGLALADAGKRAGHRRVRWVRLDSTRPGGRVWEPDLVSANAKRATADPTTVAYLGELDYGASAVSVPITNEKGILQVSPGDGLASLTTVPPGRPQAGPARYYPTDERTFVRLTPSDLGLAEALLLRIRGSGAHRLAVVCDDHIYGRELAAELVARAHRDGPEPVAGEELHGDDPTAMPGLVKDLADEHPDVVVYAGVSGPLTAPFLTAMARGLPNVPVFATSGVLARTSALRVAPRRVEVLSTLPPAARLPLRARRLLRRIARRAGLRSVDPEAIYGYESMRLALDAVDRAGANRRGVVRAARMGDRRASTLASDRFALYRLRHGRFTFQRELR